MELENSLFLGVCSSHERPKTVNQEKQACFCSKYLWSNFFFPFGYCRIAVNVLL